MSPLYLPHFLCPCVHNRVWLRLIGQSQPTMPKKTRYASAGLGTKAQVIKMTGDMNNLSQVIACNAIELARERERKTAAL